MMVVDRKTGTIEHKMFKDILTYFDENDMFIVNNTKVFLPECMVIKKKLVQELKFFTS